MNSVPHSLKVPLYPLGDLLSLARAVCGREPFHRLPVKLPVVTTAIVVAKRNDVVSRIPATARNRNPVILSKSVKQSGGAATDRTLKAKILKREFPILSRESRWEAPLPCIPDVRELIAPLAVLFLPVLACSRLLVRIVLSPLATCGATLFGLFFSLSSTALPHLLFVFWRGIALMTRAVGFVVGVAFVFAAIGRFAIVGAAAFGTYMPHSIMAPREKGKGLGKEAIAIETTIRRRRQVKHSVSLSLYHMMWSADGVICRRSDREATPYLADTPSIPDRKTVCNA